LPQLISEGGEPSAPATPGLILPSYTTPWDAAALEIQTQRLVQRFTVPAGKSLEITGAAAAAQDPQHRHQQQESLGVAHPTAIASIWDALEEADQVISSELNDCSRADFMNWER
jgi:hypothetical protein